MSESKKKMWMVRAGKRAYLFDTFKQENITGLGFKKVRNLGDAYNNKEKVQAKVNQGYRDRTPRSRSTVVRALHLFRTEIEEGHWVIMSSPGGRECMVGTVIGDYQYNPDQEGRIHIRQAQWNPKSVAKSGLSPDIVKRLNKPPSVFPISNADRNKILKAVGITP